MLYKNAMVFTGEGRFVPGSFRVEDGRFQEVLDVVPSEEGVDLGGSLVIPGLVDLHTHGCAGADFSDGDPEGLRAMGEYSARHGITAFAPTSMTLPYEALEKAFATAAAYCQQPPAAGARLLGIHMEGPYLSEKKKGAQNAAWLRLPDLEGFRALYEGCGGRIRIVDVAAETEGAEEFIREASRLCRVSIAHTDADYDTACLAFGAGASHLTHLYNAMPSIHHRKPGVIGAASERETVTAELISDGIHVHPSAVRMAFRLFPGRICLVSDSIRCCGMPEGTYTLGGQTLRLLGRCASLEDGTIAGSATDLYDCMCLAMSFGIPREEAVLAATLLPARVLGREAEIGSVEVGKLADFVVCDASFRRKAVFLGGKRIPSDSEQKSSRIQ